MKSGTNYASSSDNWTMFGLTFDARSVTPRLLSPLQRAPKRLHDGRVTVGDVVRDGYEYAVAWQTDKWSGVPYVEPSDDVATYLNACDAEGWDFVDFQPAWFRIDKGARIARNAQLIVRRPR